MELFIKYRYGYLLFCLISFLDIYGQGCEQPDVTAPLIFDITNITLPNDIGQCSAHILPEILGYPETADACGVISTLATNIPPGYVFPVGVTIVIWTATDAAGNASSLDQIVTIIDIDKPEISCVVEITVNTSPRECTAFVNVLATATDNCSIVSFENDYNNGGGDASGVYPLGTTTVTYTATDSAGLTVSCVTNVTVVNSQIPVITLLNADTITLEACNEYVEYGAQAFDNCLGVLSNDITIDASNVITNQVGSYQVFYNVTNASGVAANPVVRTVNIVDTTAPNLTLIGPSVLNIGDCSTYTELGAIAIDPCFGNISSNIVIDNSSIDTSILGSYTVTYNVTDANNNVATQITRSVNVTDTSPPEITLLGDNPQIIEACDSYAELGAIALEPCFEEDLSDELVIDSSNVDTNTIGIYTVTYNITDSEGNEAIEITRVVEVIDSTAPTITLLGDNPQIIEACTAYFEFGATVNDCSTNSLEINTASIDINNAGIYSVNYTACDVYGNCSNISRDVQVVISNPTVNAGSDFINSVCTETTINLAANPAIGSDATGLWTVTSGQISDFSFSDPTSSTSIFTGDVGETYVLTWTITDACRSISDSITVTFINCSALDFDGIDDNITFRDNYNLTNDFSVEIWVKSEAQNNKIQTILSKREVNNLINGYDIRVVDNYVSFNWNNAEFISSSPHQINTNQWHHLVVTFSNNTYNLIIDGVLVDSKNGTLPLANNSNFIIGAMHNSVNPPFRPENYFDGGMDELHIWDTALSVNQIRKMMNQEIENSSGNIVGSEIPIEINGLTWNDLNGYYRMNQSSDLFGGNLVPTNGNGINGLLRFMTTLQPETAPIPYVSNNNGNWTDNNTWLHGNVQAIPNSIGVDGATAIDWTIVKTSHNISSGNNNITVLGLKVNNNVLTIENNDSLFS